jgi:ThiF family
LSLIALASRNDDLRRLLEKGYALRVDGGYLVVRDVPYLDATGTLRLGAIVAKLVFVDSNTVKQDDHQVYFAGSAPHGLDGAPVPNLGGGPTTFALGKNDITVERSFSNKSSDGFANFFDKIEHYVALVAGPAMSKHKAPSPFTFRVDHDVVIDSVFKFHDTLTSRAELGDLAALFKNEVVAVIGLGGTGSYLLDFLVKTPVKEIRGFDGDGYYVHNAYRSPGRLQQEELGQPKSEVYFQRYTNFRHGLIARQTYITADSAAELQGVTFAFVCVDKGSARSEIFDVLIKLKIPFIDVGMGLNRKRDALSGTLRATYYSAEDAPKVRALQLAETADHPEDVYRTTVQISELNAMNACLAVIRYKQLRGFYLDDCSAFHILMGVENLHTFAERR